jgi:hypothetical protein
MSMIGNFTGYALLAMALPVPAALQSAELRPSWPSSFAPDLKQYEVLVIDYRTVTRGTRVVPIIDHDYAMTAFKDSLRLAATWQKNIGSGLARALGEDEILKIEAKTKVTTINFSSPDYFNAETPAAKLAPPRSEARR